MKVIILHFFEQVLVEGVVGSYLGDIAIDDVSFSNGCMLVQSKLFYPAISLTMVI